MKKVPPNGHFFIIFMLLYYHKIAIFSSLVVSIPGVYIIYVTVHFPWVHRCCAAKLSSTVRTLTYIPVNFLGYIPPDAMERKDIRMNDSALTSFLLNADRQSSLTALVSCNQFTHQFGVSLSEEDAAQLLECRRESLTEFGRIEFEGGILPKLIYTFCDSPYIYQDNYLDTLITLQNIFYLYKNESLDELSDDELLQYMKTHFEGECRIEEREGLQKKFCNTG